MKCLLVLIVCLLLSGSVCNAGESIKERVAGDTFMTQKWFDATSFSLLEIRNKRASNLPTEDGIISRLTGWVSKGKKAKNSDNPDFCVSINDGAFIARIKASLEKIDADGQCMIKMGPDARHLELIFSNDGRDCEAIDIYGDKIKTPSTGFHSQPCDNEKAVVADINALVDPQLSTPLPQIIGHEYSIEDFYITFLGSESKNLEPATITLSTAHFLLKDSQGIEQKIKVVSGQVSPAPKEFIANRKNYLLLTYKAKNGERLYPYHFELTRK